MESNVQLIARAEKILDRTLAYHAAQAVHDLRETLGIDIEQIQLSAKPMPNDSTCYRVVCTITTLAAPGQLEIEMVVKTARTAKSGARAEAA
jgi:hypothetical protein